MSELPKGWVEVKLPEFAEVVMGQSPASSDCNNTGEGIPFFQGKAEFRKLYPEVRKYCTKPKKLAKAKDILLSVRAPVGPTNLASDECVIGRGLAAIRAFEQEENYLLHYFRAIEPWMSQQGTGSTFKAISGQFLKELKVNVAPLNEQKRIVEKLDEVLAKVDIIKVRLDGIPAILKRFRQSVLAAAVSGKLTEEWRGNSSYDTRSLLYDFPTSWNNTKIANLVDYVTSGSRGWAKYYADQGSVFIRSQDINSDDLAFDETAYVQLPERVEGRRTKVQLDDILLTITGANVTRCARVKQYFDDAYVSQHVALIRLNNIENAPFIEFVLKALNSGRKQLTDMAYGGGKPGLNLQNIKDVEFALPSIEEQKEIVRLVDQYFAFADTIEAQVKKAQTRVDNLTQSILAKAFRGELVPQDPNDEPADKLLERIAAARKKAEELAKATKKALSTKEAVKKKTQKA